MERNNDRYLPVKDVVEMLAQKGIVVSANTLYRWLKLGKLRGKRVGGKVYIHSSAVEELLK